jgi:hypothetical protein
VKRIARMHIKSAPLLRRNCFRNRHERTLWGEGRFASLSSAPFPAAPAMSSRPKKQRRLAATPDWTSVCSGLNTRCLDCVVRRDEEFCPRDCRCAGAGHGAACAGAEGFVRLSCDTLASNEHPLPMRTARDESAGAIRGSSSERRCDSCVVADTNRSTPAFIRWGWRLIDDFQPHVEAVVSLGRPSPGFGFPAQVGTSPLPRRGILIRFRPYGYARNRILSRVAPSPA